MPDRPISDCLPSGEMEERIRNFDWKNSPFGGPDTWPRSLRVAVDLVLANPIGMFLAWGPKLSLIYNDAYIPILRHRHPDAFMRPMGVAWKGTWPEGAREVERVLAGESRFFEDLKFEIDRDGVVQPAWFTFSYTPLRDDDGRICGLVGIVRETTRRVQAEALQGFRLKVAEQIRSLADPDQIAETACRLLGHQLQASRVLYMDVDEEAGLYKGHHDWTDGTVPSMADVTGKLDAFGQALLNEARQGRSSIVADVKIDPLTAESADRYGALSIRSFISVPVVKEGRLIAVMGVHSSSPRHWMQADVELAQIISDYTWPAVEHSRAEKELQASVQAEARRFKELFEAAPMPIIVLRGRNLLVEMANPALNQMIGERDITGKPLLEAVPELAGQGFESLLGDLFMTGKPFVGHGMKIVLQRKPGELPAVVYHDALYQPLFDRNGTVSGIFCLANDVTDAYRAQEALRESEERLREGMDAARMVVWDWDPVSGHIRLSENVSSIFGGNWDNSEGIYQSIHPADIERLRNARLQATPENPRYTVEFRLIRPDNGETVWLENRSHVQFDDNGRPWHVTGVSLDITKRKRSEEELREANRQKDEFLAMLGHELRNPLAPIRSAAELLTLVHLDENKLRAASEVIVRQVDHMTELVDDLLDVSRVTRGLVTLNKTIVDLKRVVSSAIEQVRPLIEARHHALSVHITPEPARTLGDEKRLVQVVANILNNAAKYTPEGGRIELHLERFDGEIQIRIQDNGIGIPADLQPYVFDLFRQATRTPDRAQGGLGLGLALVKSLMELHGGHVTVESAGSGCGSTFTLSLARLEADRRGTGRTRQEASIVPADKALDVLIVDDNQDAARMLSIFLEAAGHRVTATGTAQRALDIAAARSFDVFLLDIGLPDVDGYALVRQLRALPESAHATMIAVTGYGQESDRQTALDSGFDLHFVKPVNTQVLLDALARLH